ncbi:MAG: DNA-processing protein DprA [Cyclobacteriaceae bacterium]|nr:DNA-processing protein DprA [Cyclobacteriaceae bacterium]
MTTDMVSHVALQLVPGVGHNNAKYLISYCGSAEQVFTKTKKDLLRVPGIGEKSVTSILSKTTLATAEKIVSDCEKKNIRILPYTSAEYPNRLKQLPDSPATLFKTGNADLNALRTISVVGTRRATEYGKNATELMLTGLRDYAPLVISGLAYGIDIEAHRHSLNLGMPTLGVLAGGLDKIYPKIHERIARKMEENGGLISENPPGTQPDSHLFPARNRIIAGLGDATVVIEAASKGGALITANLADSYNLPVFAVPGNLDQEFSKGCNELINKQKALIYTQTDDIVTYLNWDKEPTSNLPAQPDYSGLNENEKKIVQLLARQKEGYPIDEIAWKCQLQINQLASLLLNLEFRGLIKSLPGKKYQLKS